MSFLKKAIIVGHGAVTVGLVIALRNAHNRLQMASADFDAVVADNNDKASYTEFLQGNIRGLGNQVEGLKLELSGAQKKANELELSRDQMSTRLKDLQGRFDSAGKDLFREGVPGNLLREAGLDYLPDTPGVSNSNMDTAFKAAVGLDANGKPLERAYLGTFSDRDQKIIRRLRNALGFVCDAIVVYQTKGVLRGSRLLHDVAVARKEEAWNELYENGKEPSVFSVLNQYDAGRRVRRGKSEMRAASAGSVPKSLPAPAKG